jgi:hypothetical protein
MWLIIGPEDDHACPVCRMPSHSGVTQDAFLEASPKLRDGLRAYGGDFLEMMASRTPLLATDEDVDEVLGKFPFLSQRYGEFGTAIHRMVEHQIRTGHNVLFFKSRIRSRHP